MKRLALLFFGIIVLLAGGAATDLALNPPHRIAVMEGLCKAGLPNLSRPPEVDADKLGCAVLGRKHRVVGYVSSSFEHSTLYVGDRIELAADGFHFLNQSARFSGTRGLRERGGAALRRELDVLRPGLCGDRLAKVVVEGWMTVSPGEYGHLGGAKREFYAYRVVSASDPTAEDVRAFGLPTWAYDQTPGFAEHCRARELGETEGL